MSVDLETVTGQVISRLRLNPKVSGPITGATVITDDLGLDSLTIMNFVMEIEDEFDVSDDLARCLVELKS